MQIVKCVHIVKSISSFANFSRSLCGLFLKVIIIHVVDIHDTSEEK